MTNYNDGEWHGWDGGECPVHPKTVVQIMMRCEIGEEWNDVSNEAQSYWWHRSGHAGDIIAFRVVKEHKEPREFWLCESTYKPFTAKPPFGGFIHVREVIE